MPLPSTAYGRFQAPEPPSALACLVTHDGTTELKTVDWEPKVAVLDQQDLIAQGIFVDTFIPGAQRVNALGSCTANATTAAYSNITSETEFMRVTGATSFADAVGAEKWAITFYHICTDQTGDPSQEWPPTDCGSSGPFIVSELTTLKLISTANIAHGADNLCYLLQSGGVLQGTPFLYAWEEPGPDHFVDGDGSYATLQSQLRQGVAGGHETYISAIEKITVLPTGHVDPFNTVLRVRNSWSKSWGDSGSFYIHLSTLVALGSYCDFRQIVA